MRVVVILLAGLSLSGCILYDSWMLTRAERRMQEERHQILHDYRVCLQEKGNNPEKQKDCAVYNQALYQVDVKGLR